MREVDHASMHPARRARRRVGLLLALLLTAPFAHGLTLEEQRAEYDAALADLYAVRLKSFDARLERLADYPLLPYLHYQRLMRYVSSASPEQVSAFRTRFAETPLADIALRQWLDNLAERGQWALYRDHYDAEIAGGTAAECRYHRARLETGEVEEAFAAARRLWLVDHSQPDVCDPLFSAWQRAGGIDDALAWERLHLAVSAGRTGLGSYLTRFLDEGASRALGEQYLALHRSPHRLARMDRVGDGSRPEREAQIVAHTLERLARRDARLADAQWQRWRTRLAFAAHQAAAVREQILRYTARQDGGAELMQASWPPPELADRVAEDLVAELARRAISEARWEDAASWIDRLPEHARRKPAWQYWTARAAAVTGDSEAPDSSIGTARGSMLPPEPDAVLTAAPAPAPSATARLDALSRQRNYYGFLAADRLGRPYALEAAEADVTDAEISALKRRPALQRAIELRAIGELPEARREIAWLMRRLSDRDLLVLAEYARRIGWHRQSIQATIAAEHWDQIDLRFPLAYADTMIASAQARDLPPHWLFAVARQESAFMHDARSGAGALGIMQLLPSTARSTARSAGIPLGGTWQLIDERKNIEIGSTYLSQMYERYDRNRILASAAYNAGPGRVDRWVKERDPHPADVFVETIPFRETRGYVQNILAFSLIYAMRLGEEQPFLYDHEK
ncbi:MAG: transglycosylase SLT domain-containing protein [Pseudomonadales bacterium]|jgi:soluble lytic murein transglycosylase|nr:transglycosylase SLT domain-containing protein [Pseudomonadales bacterium]